MLKLLGELYNIRENDEQYNYRRAGEDVVAPVILGSVTKWHLQEMVSAQVYVNLLLYHHLQGELRTVGAAVAGIVPPLSQQIVGAPISEDGQQDFAAILEHLLDALVARLMDN